MMGRTRLRFDEHLTDEAILHCLDGELAPKDVEQVQRHLEACWSCRARSEAMQAAIARFIEYRDAAFTAAAETPPDGWRSFRPHLTQQAASGRDAVTQRFRSIVETRVAYAALAAFLLFAAFVWVSRPRVQIVSAHVYLDRSEAAERQELQRVFKPLVHKRIHVRGRDQTGEWETWMAPSEKKFKESWNAPSSLRDGLHAIFEDNRINQRDPISAVNFGSWRDAIGGAPDTLTSESGYGLVTLRAVTGGTRRAGQIIEARLVIRSNDWHAVEQTLVVKGEKGNEEFQLLELDYSVSTWNEATARMFAGDLPNATRAARSAIESPVIPPATLAPILGQVNDVEIQVRVVLNTLQADLGEQIGIERAADRVLVRGVVGTASRKAELTAALTGIADVSVDLTTAEDAQPTAVRATQSPMRVAELASPTAAGPPLGSLLESRFPERTEREGFVNNVVRVSQDALSRTWALRRLAERSDATTINSLSAVSKDQLGSLVHGHSKALRTAGEQLSVLLDSLFSEPLEEQSAPGPKGDWRMAVERVFSEVGAVDRITVRLLTGSAAPAGQTQVMIQECARHLAAFRQWMPQLETQIATTFGEH